MNKALTLIGGAALGGGLMYMLDPDRGRRRRAFVRDKSVGAWNRAGETVSKTSRDIANRAKGAAYESTRMFRRAGEQRADDVRRAGHDAGFVLMREDWPPAWRAIIGVAGGALATYGFIRRDTLGYIASTAGIAMAARGATNRDATRLFGLVKRAGA